jgi:hypothetical protein
MSEAADTSFWQVPVLPESHRIASNPSPFGLQTRQIRAERGICESLGIKIPAREVHPGFDSGHPATMWCPFYENLRAGRAWAFEYLEIRESPMFTGLGLTLAGTKNAGSADTTVPDL